MKLFSVQKILKWEVGVSLFMRKSDFLFGTIIGKCLLRHSDNLSKALQSPQVSALEGQKMAALLLKHWKHYGMMQHLGKFWDKVNLKGKELDVSKPQLPRRQPSKRVDGGQSDMRFAKTE